MSLHADRVLTQKQYAFGYIELALAQFCVGVNVIAGKLLIGYFPILFLLMIRFAIGFAGMLLIANFAGIKPLKIAGKFWSLDKKDKCLLIIQALCGGFLFNIFILYGMKSTTATSAGIISSITPVVIFLFSAVLLREKITSQKIIAIIIAMIGLLILNTDKGMTLEGALLGNLLVLIAVIPESLFTILSKSVGSKIHQTEAVTLVNFFNLILFIPLILISQESASFANIPLSIYSLLGLYGLTGGIMFFLLWYRGLTKIDANVAAFFTGIMPISTTLLAYLFLNEPITINDFLGMVFVLCAIFMACYQTKWKK